MIQTGHAFLMTWKQNLNRTLRCIVLISLCLITQKALGQSGDLTVKALVDLGFENVSCVEDEKERVYVVENVAYRLSGIGIGVAIDQIQATGLPEDKSCRLIVLENNVPLISLNYKPIVGDSGASNDRQDWDVSYDLGDSWEKVKGEKSKNRSLYKIDVVIYPEFSFRNLILTQIYEILLNLNPTVEISLWKGMKFTGQVIVPVFNDYGVDYRQIRQGYITVSQTVRLPHNIIITAAAGTFNNRRWGVDLKAKHVLKRNERFSFEGRVGYTGMSGFDHWTWHFGSLKRLTWTAGGHFYWAKYNTQVSLRAEQYLLGEKGVRFDFMRNFRHTSIGVYAMEVQHAPRNGGFYIQIALPPYGKYKRGHLRVTPSKYFGFMYNAGNEQFYGKSYTALLGTTYAYEMNYNPYFIKSELLNY